MKHLTLTLVLLVSLPLTVSAQFNLADFGLGPFLPFVVELDGNPATTEWMAQTADNELWVINPATMCKSKVKTKGKRLPGFYFIYLQRIYGLDRLVIIDIDPSDGQLPAYVQDIVSYCY